MSGPEVVVVGGGLAGLAAARHLARAGRSILVLEASDGVGGRARSDRVGGFVLDRGFQVLLTAYPEARAALDLAALDLRRFRRGALVHYDGRFHAVADPWRAPASLPSTLAAPIGSPLAKLRLAALGVAARTWPDDGPVAGRDQTAGEWLAEAGLSGPMTERFLRPLLAGGLLDPQLGSSARQARFVWRCLVTGDAAVPAGGIGAMAEQMAADLPPGVVRVDCRVDAVEPRRVTLAGGEVYEARCVLVATAAPEAARLLGDGAYDPGSQGVGCLWYAASAPPAPTTAVILEGQAAGPVNLAAVLSNVAPSYAPAGAALVAAQVFDLESSDAALDAAARGQLRGWWRDQVDGWQLLRVDRIRHAQPAQPPGRLTPARRPVRIDDGLYVCGDHVDNASIQGALVSGRRAAEAMLADLY